MVDLSLSLSLSEVSDLVEGDTHALESGISF